jgi:hypothetical protein
MTNIANDIDLTITNVTAHTGVTIEKVGVDVDTTMDHVSDDIDRGDYLGVLTDSGKGIVDVASDVVEGGTQVGEDIATGGEHIFEHFTGGIKNIVSDFTSNVRDLAGDFTTWHAKPGNYLHLQRRAIPDSYSYPWIYGGTLNDGGIAGANTVPDLQTGIENLLSGFTAKVHRLANDFTMWHGTSTTSNSLRPSSNQEVLHVQRRALTKTDRYNFKKGGNQVTVTSTRRGGALIETRYVATLTFVPGWTYHRYPWSQKADTKFDLRQNPAQDDERGHMIAQLIGGPSVDWNLQPQSHYMNRGDGTEVNWRKVENRIADWIAEPGCEVEWDLQLEYNDPRPRPSRYVLVAMYHGMHRGQRWLRRKHELWCPNYAIGQCTFRETRYQVPGFKLMDKSFPCKE